ncbi:acetyl-CoA carboxylase biotin carboxyl carrier protein [Chelatococcus asaccharovorans]|uniref:acetyl-CoA carboxylase biotin carboxyl carrier protein n=1 Tax=Chelatococcus asaccharovorans TaxID=28210 RepID=UPI00224C700B|nr:acetyl-CoA carboxylase biotin carboxyl carrier protein [Chelatococcus asaccharovorans]CAH1669278.1 Biotin carboxyl carrier protein of acetyl-CoA carboxylase [Chelatococcus asaccharovorans]CAH1679295.1 Biotin carboxyl carrier protein of acetyl-CoA carboxylase [Chelatococcus asaccharovorans]
MPVKSEEIATLIELFNESDWDELHVAIEGLQLFLSTDPNARLYPGSAAVTAAPAPAPAISVQPVAVQAPAARLTTPAPAQDEAVPAHWVPVKAPNLGTFYRAPKPGAAPFVEIGQAVEASTEICLLEVMKLFTAVQAGTKGTVRRVCVDDAEMVEHGQVLFYIEP